MGPLFQEAVQEAQLQEQEESRPVVHVETHERQYPGRRLVGSASQARVRQSRRFPSTRRSKIYEEQVPRMTDTPRDRESQGERSVLCLRPQRNSVDVLPTDKSGGFYTASDGSSL